MTRDEAEAEAVRLGAEHPQRGSYRWFARESAADGWAVARVPMPPGISAAPLEMKPEIRADEKPPTPDDPRSPYERNVGGLWAG